ncbi:MAG: response regulator transcription factor [Cyanobacteria bacterium SIG28]|nr:response regulator transcription factor [Cyanobacteria bacterium SIG28]
MKNERFKMLTEREKNILYLLVEGFTNKEIAEKLFISVHTVKAHLEAIYEKLGVNNRVQTVIKAVKLGLVEI